MSISSKVAGAWKLAGKLFIKQAGAWKQVQKGFVKQAGAWKLFYQLVTITPAYVQIVTQTPNYGVLLESPEFDPGSYMVGEVGVNIIVLNASDKTFVRATNYDVDAGDYDSYSQNIINMRNDVNNPANSDKIIIIAFWSDLPGTRAKDPATWASGQPLPGLWSDKVFSTVNPTPFQQPNYIGFIIPSLGIVQEYMIEALSSHTGELSVMRDENGVFTYTSL